MDLLQMTIGQIFIGAIFSGVISEEELFWVTTHQDYFSRCEEATALRLGRLVDSGQIQLGCRV